MGDLYCDYMASAPMCKEAIDAYVDAAEQFTANPNGLSSMAIEGLSNGMELLQEPQRLYLMF